MSDAINQIIATGDLSKLTPSEQTSYYFRVCESVGLDPVTRPLEFLTLNGKRVLYAKRDATDQLRKRGSVSVHIVSRDVIDGLIVVVARATTPDGRSDESIGAVPIDGLKGEARANAMMKAETKAKRRATLSLCGLGLLDESEVDSLPTARREPVVALPVQHAPAALAEAKTDHAAALKAANSLQELDAAALRVANEVPDAERPPLAAIYRVRKEELTSHTSAAQ